MPININSYETFCRAFQDSREERQRAELLLTLEDWTIWLDRLYDGRENSIGLEDLLLRNGAGKPSAPQDWVSQIISVSGAAFRTLETQLRERIVRENVLMPVQKVREVNSSSMSWLSRQPGRTVREKMSRSGSMLAVRRRMSLDTGENRLLLAFLRELLDRMDCKNWYLPENLRSREETELAERISTFLHRPELAEIRRWENLPPNNTLLSDRSYRKIWDGWNLLKDLDKYICRMQEELDRRLADYVLFRLLTLLRKRIRFPQMPVLFDRESGQLTFCREPLRGWDGEGFEVEILPEREGFTFRYRSALVQFTFRDAVMTARNRITGQRLEWRDWTRALAERPHLLGEDEQERRSRCRSLIADPFMQYPVCLCGEGAPEFREQRLMCQNYRYNGAEYSLRCGDSEVVCWQEKGGFSTVFSAVRAGESAQLTALMRMLAELQPADQLTFLFPDVCSAFQLTPLQRAARSAFREVHALPESVGTAFAVQERQEFLERVKDGDFLLIADLSGPGWLSLTLIRRTWDQALERRLPESRGIVWERHPNGAVDCRSRLKALSGALEELGCEQAEWLLDLMGVRGLEEECFQLDLLNDNDRLFPLGDEVREVLRNWELDVTGEISDFLARNKNTVENAEVHIISLSDHLNCRCGCDLRYLDVSAALEGCRTFLRRQEELGRESTEVLWRDYLPRLAIKQLYGQFDLVRDSVVTPEFGRRVPIPIEETFLLPKGEKEYRFELLQGSGDSAAPFSAVVRSSVFPLVQDTECRLDMSYQYGAEEPYSLVFRPIRTGAFAEVRVQWERLEDYPFRDQLIPEMSMGHSWEELRRYQTEKHPVARDMVREACDLLRSIDRICMEITPEEQNSIRWNRMGRNHVGVLEKQLGDRTIKVRFRPSDSLDWENMLSGVRPVFCNLSELDLPDRYEPADFPKWGGKGKGAYHIGSVAGPEGEKTVAFFENQFFPEEYHAHIRAMAFRTESDFKDPTRFSAKDIVDLDNYEPGKYFNAKRSSWGFCTLVMNLVFGGEHGGADFPCELRETLEQVREDWLERYRLANEGSVRKRMLFVYLSLMSRMLREPYYLLAREYVQQCSREARSIDHSIGYALGALELPRERELLDEILQATEKNRDNALRILSKAAWNDRGFILELERETAFRYFDAAVDRLHEQREEMERRWDWAPKVGYLLEYILSVFRLRSLKEDEIDLRLSRNNLKVKQLYSDIEYLVSGKVQVKTFLQLNIADKGGLNDVPDLLYALLVYINGQYSSGDIRIVVADDGEE